MTTIELTGAELIVHVQGLDKVLSFKSEIRVPLAHVEGVAPASEEAAAPKGTRAPGISIPGLTAGTFYGPDGRAFWDVHDAAKAIVIYLRHDTFTKLIVEVEDPDAVVRAITRAVATPRP